MNDLSDAERRMLLLIYELSNGETEKILNRKSVSAALNLSPREGEKLLKALTARRMIRYIVFGSLCLTEAGLVAARRLMPQIPGGAEENAPLGRRHDSIRQKTARILFLASNPETTSPLDIEEELRSLESELRGVHFRDQIVLTAGHAVRPDDLIRLLRRDRPTIVHFSGHGSPEGIVLHGFRASKSLGRYAGSAVSG